MGLKIKVVMAAALLAAALSAHAQQDCYKTSLNQPQNLLDIDTRHRAELAESWDNIFAASQNPQLAERGVPLAVHVKAAGPNNQNLIFVVAAESRNIGRLPEVAVGNHKLMHDRAGSMCHSGFAKVSFVWVNIDRQKSSGGTVVWADRITSEGYFSITRQMQAPQAFDRLLMK